MQINSKKIAVLVIGVSFLLDNSGVFATCNQMNSSLRPVCTKNSIGIMASPQITQDIGDNSPGLITLYDIIEKRLAFAMLKPDSSHTRENIMSDLTNEGFDIISILKPLILSEREIEDFYFDFKDEPWFSGHKRYMLSNRITPLVLKGPNDAWSRLRDIVGKTDGSEPGTLRYIYGTQWVKYDDGTNSLQNKIHASDSFESVMREINFFIDKEGMKSLMTPNAGKLFSDMQIHTKIKSAA